MVDTHDLIDLYGPTTPPLEEHPSTYLTLELLRTCLATTPPRSSPHRDGWRNERRVDLARDTECGTALARELTAVVTGDVPKKTMDILSLATLIILLKNNAKAMAELKLKQGAAYLQSQRPIGMGTALVKTTCNCALLMVRDAMGPDVGPSQFAVKTKGDCALLQWTLQMGMEAKPSLAGARLDAINAYGDIERECIEAVIKANPYLHRLLSLYELLYKHRERVLWYYDENGKFVMGAKNKRGVR